MAGRSAFTLIEMLTTVAVLIIVLGLMVSLARYVRDRSANQLTQQLLLRLDELVRQYQSEHNDHLPDVPGLIPVGETDPKEQAVRAAARVNNAKFVNALRADFARNGWFARAGAGAPAAAAALPATRDARSPSPGTATNGGVGGAGTLSAQGAAPDRSDREAGFGDLPISLYNGRFLADAWGNPIVFMPDQHPAIGMAPPSNAVPPKPGGTAQTFFFFSPGPDGKYLTREDNVYSYEQVRGR